MGAGSLPHGSPVSVTLRITRLLDMPIDNSLLGAQKKYRVVVLDQDERELVRTHPIESMPGDRANAYAETEDVTVLPSEGVVVLETLSPLLHLEVKYADAGLANRTIGRAQIHRADPRSQLQAPHAYALADRRGDPVNAGIEVMVQEGAMHQPGGPPMGTPMGSRPPMSMPPQSGMPPTGMPPPPLASGQPQMHPMMGGSVMPGGAPVADVEGHMTFASVEDFPPPPEDPNAPRSERRQRPEQVLITVEDAHSTGKELAQLGPFLTAHDSNGLRSVDCQGRMVTVQVPYRVGDAARDGAMYVKVKVWYVTKVFTEAGQQGGNQEALQRNLIGQTNEIPIMWVGRRNQYVPMTPERGGRAVGGVRLSYKLAKDKDAPGTTTGMSPGVQRPRPTVPNHVSGRTGHFPKGSPEEADEQACINFEAQNRANHQRIKKILPGSTDTSGHDQMVNGYREWDNLDSLFYSLGPSPLMASEEVGPSITRAYLERTSVMAEAGPKIAQALDRPAPVPQNPDQAALDRQLVGMEYGGDPYKLESWLRPVVCKDPEYIAATKDMQWCPDPPMYAAIKNMTEQDQETLRLACLYPSQCAKLPFADANPAYNINADIWAPVADERMAQAAIISKPYLKQKRVKDSCIMA